MLLPSFPTISASIEVEARLQIKATLIFLRKHITMLKKKVLIVLWEIFLLQILCI
jgi:hypothetical protein